MKNGTRSLSEKWETLLGCWLTVGKIKWKGPLLHWCQYLSRKHIRRYIDFKQFICLDAVLFLRLFSDVKKQSQHYWAVFTYLAHSVPQFDQLLYSHRTETPLPQLLTMVICSNRSSLCFRYQPQLKQLFPLFLLLGYVWTFYYTYTRYIHIQGI